MFGPFSLNPTWIMPRFPQETAEAFGAEMRRCLQEQAIKYEESEYTGRLKVEDSGRMWTEERQSTSL